jgi:hypothetical protein
LAGSESEKMFGYESDTVIKYYKNNSEKSEVIYAKENKMNVFFYILAFFCSTGFGIHMKAMRATL